MVLAKAQTHRSVEQNRNPEIDPHKYGFNLLLKKEQKQLNEGYTSKWYRSSWTSIGKNQQNKNYNLNLTPYTKFKSICIMELNVRHKTTKLLGKK